MFCLHLQAREVIERGQNIKCTYIEGNQTTQTESTRTILVGPYEKTTLTINNYCCLSFFLIKLMEIIKICATSFQGF